MSINLLSRSVPLLVCFWLLAIGTVLGQPQPQSPMIQSFLAERVFEEGKKLFQAGSYQAALGKFNEVATLNSNHPQVYEMRGECYYQLGDFNRAIDDYTVAARQQPRNAELRNSMGVAAANLKYYDAAVSYFYEALQIDPTHKAARDNLALAQTKAGNSNNGGNSNAGGNNGRPPREDPWGTPAQPTPTPPKQPTGRSTARETIYGKDQILVGNRNDKFLSIEQVRVTPRETLVTMVIKSTSSKPFPVRLEPANSANALYLTDRNFQRSYRLIRIQQLDGWPQKPYMLQPGQDKLFIAVFERIADDIQVFHLLEGKSTLDGAWNFWDVELKD
ncbi:MAG: tetratricopeptide repeat protein [Bacteroidia bacterium]|nr:tetratricopeptide repeat protein [Bacteroidia bacterium]